MIKLFRRFVEFICGDKFENEFLKTINQHIDQRMDQMNEPDFRFNLSPKPTVPFIITFCNYGDSIAFDTIVDRNDPMVDPNCEGDMSTFGHIAFSDAIVDDSSPYWETKSIKRGKFRFSICSTDMKAATFNHRSDVIEWMSEEVLSDIMLGKLQSPMVVR